MRRLDKYRDAKGSLIPPTPSFVRETREGLGISRKVLAQGMGYTESYIRGVETEGHKVTPEFSERFWDFVKMALSDEVTKRIDAVVPVGVKATRVVVTNLAKCACGCGTWFSKNSPNHKYVSAAHRRRMK